jgi:hypothetical protein
MNKLAPKRATTAIGSQTNHSDLNIFEIELDIIFGSWGLYALEFEGLSYGAISLSYNQQIIKFLGNLRYGTDHHWNTLAIK